MRQRELDAVRAGHVAMRARVNAGCRWWLLTPKGGGDTQLVRGVLAEPWPSGYDPAAWDARWVAAPGVHGQHEGRRWVEDTAAAERFAYAARLNLMTRAEFADHILERMRAGS